jgi:hypothetical protein
MEPETTGPGVPQALWIIVFCHFEHVGRPVDSFRGFGKSEQGEKGFKQYMVAMYFL